MLAILCQELEEQIKKPMGLLAFNQPRQYDIGQRVPLRVTVRSFLHVTTSCLINMLIDLGSISAVQTPAARTDSAFPSDRPQVRTLDSTRSIASLRSPLLGPERANKNTRGKKPGNIRRVSSTQGPYRGQEFSVEDAMHEIEDDMAPRPGLSGSSSGYGSTRQPPASVRRRSTQAPTLARVDSAHEDESRSAAQSLGGRGDGIQEESEHGDEEDAMMRDAAVNGDEDGNMGDDDEDGDISDAESFTMKHIHLE